MRKQQGILSASSDSSCSGRTVFRVEFLLLAIGLSAILFSAPARTDQPSPEIAQQQAPAGQTFSVVPRTAELTYYPCLQCHEFLTPNPQVRDLFSPHPSDLNHGDQRIWCLTCHNTENRNYLTSLLGEPIEFDDSPELCASCHMQRYNDWKFGAHGKRQADWSGERVIYACPHCHDPHDPSIKARAPKPLPPVRKGLERGTHSHEARKAAWDRPTESRHE